ncbi:preprotein translocase subunit SecE [Patescibacteria group bacterium]|nr:preprotein translocase subunit SecE [Patescibacteria group bacterium]
MALRFFYDSLDTVKKLKRPTKKDYINLTIAIFAAVIIGGFFFVALDTLFSNGYQIFYHIMTPTS